MTLFQEFKDKGLLNEPPEYIGKGIQYECVTGSHAYGTATDKSDYDIYGVCIPPKEYIFPHMQGKIVGFDKNPLAFNIYEQHHIFTKEKKEYDVTIYSIIKYFSLLEDNNPNILDSLFVPNSCVLYSSPAWKLVRESRRSFLSKNCWYKFRGYARSQMKRLKNRNYVGKRMAIIDKYGYDVKSGAHCIRLMLQLNQIIRNGDMDFLANKGTIKKVRNGEWEKDDLIDFFDEIEEIIEKKFEKCLLPSKPDHKKIRGLLINCLEEFYGDLKGCCIER